MNYLITIITGIMQLGAMGVAIPIIRVIFQESPNTFYGKLLAIWLTSVVLSFEVLLLVMWLRIPMGMHWS